ncbi:MAG: hypothetical protein ACYC40_00930 [Patescibacteria group bacterium]
MDQVIAKEMLKQIFNEITANASEFIEWGDYNLAEVMFPNLKDKVGIGFKLDNSAITLFYIEAVNYGPYYKKYRPTMRIGQAAALENRYWDMQLEYYGLTGVKIKDDFLIQHHKSIAKPILQKFNALEMR